MPVTREEICYSDLREAVEYMWDLSAPDMDRFDRLVKEGASGDEYHEIHLSGDDFASWCHYFHVLLTYFEINPDLIDRYRNWEPSHGRQDRTLPTPLGDG